MNKKLLALTVFNIVCLALSVNAFTITYGEKEYNGSKWFVSYSSEDKEIKARFVPYRITYYYPRNYFDGAYYYTGCYGYNCPAYYTYKAYPVTQYYVFTYPMPYYVPMSWGYPFGWVRTIGRANYCIGWDCSYFN